MINRCSSAIFAGEYIFMENYYLLGVEDETDKNVMLDIDETITRPYKNEVLKALEDKIALEEGLGEGAKVNLNEELLRQAESDGVIHCYYPEVRQQALDLLSNPDFLLSLKPDNRSLEACEIISGAGYNIYVASARQEYLKPVTLQWFKEWGFDSYITQLIQRPKGIESIAFKKMVAQYYSVQTAFEDDPYISQILARAGIPVRMVRRSSNQFLKSKSLINPHDSLFEAAVSFVEDESRK